MYTYYRHRLTIPCGHAHLKAELTIPARSGSIIIFSPEEGGITFGNRNRLVAHHLHKLGFGTLFPQLLTLEESKRYGRRFDLDLQTARLMTVTEYLREHDRLSRYTLAYFGTGISSAAVLQSAAYLPEYISAVVCRHARPDFVPNALSRITAPTLLIAAAQDRYTLRLNREALEDMTCERELIVIEGATQLFEGSAMTDVAELTGSWFSAHLQQTAVAHP
ncbi:MAG: alpha/beta hydrolase [Bacteroidetes bacterium]|nr:alpha/beta hydrolase [Bacteroidota bacterium]